MKHLHVTHHVCASVMAFVYAKGNDFMRTQDLRISRDRGADKPASD